MREFLIVLQIIVSLLFVGAILIQTKGTGFGRSWGASSSFARRGIERLVFRSTFVLGALFILLATAIIVFY